MLKALKRRVVRMVLAIAVVIILTGQPFVAIPYTTLPVFAGECATNAGPTCGG